MVFFHISLASVLLLFDLLCFILLCFTLLYVVLHCLTLHYVAVICFTLLFFVVLCFALIYITLLCLMLFYFALLASCSPVATMLRSGQTDLAHVTVLRGLRRMRTGTAEGEGRPGTCNDFSLASA